MPAFRTIFLIAIMASPALSYSFDFKGVALGTSMTPDQIFERLGVKCAKGIAEMQICNGPVSMGNESASMNLVINAEGVVSRIVLSMKPYSFDIVAPLLIEKFGSPARSSTGTLQNRMGASFVQHRHEWVDTKGAEVIYEKYSGSIDRSTLSMSTKSDRDFLRARAGNRRGDI